MGKFPTRKQGKISHQYFSANSFRGTALTFVRPQSLSVLSRGDTWNPYCTQLQLGMKRNFSAFFMSVKTFAVTQTLLKIATVDDQTCPCEQ
jgi:hypothetical protein